MKLDVSDALAHPGQEYRFSGTQAIADQEIAGDTVRLDDCTVEGTFLADEDGNIAVKGKLRAVAHAPCANCLGTRKPKLKTASTKRSSAAGIRKTMKSLPTTGMRFSWTSW